MRTFFANQVLPFEETIGEPLQSALEKQHREYIKCLTNADVYYDPKELDPSNIGKIYNEVIEWVQKNNCLGYR